MNLKRLNIESQETEIFKTEDIIKNANSEYLYISSWVDFKVDLSNFKYLKHLRCTTKTNTNINSAITLESLVLSPFLKRKDNIEELKNLEILVLSQSDFENLGFISKMNILEILEVQYFPKLTDISALQNNESIEYLQFYSCKKLTELEVLKSMKKLKRLHIENMVIPDIDFVKDIKNLNFLSLMGTNVLSGDISPAKDIDFVSIDNRRHYNYRWDDTTRRIYPK